MKLENRVDNTFIKKRGSSSFDLILIRLRFIEVFNYVLCIFNRLETLELLLLGQHQCQSLVTSLAELEGFLIFFQVFILGKL